MNVEAIWDGVHDSIKKTKSLYSHFKGNRISHLFTYFLYNGVYFTEDHECLTGLVLRSAHI